MERGANHKRFGNYIIKLPKYTVSYHQETTNHQIHCMKEFLGFLLLRQGFMQLKLSSNSSIAENEPPISTSQVCRLQMCTTMPASMQCWGSVPAHVVQAFQHQSYVPSSRILPKTNAIPGGMCHSHINKKCHFNIYMALTKRNWSRN